MAVTGKNGFYERHTAAADGAASTHTVRIKSIIWTGTTAATNAFSMKDGSGTVVIGTMTAGGTGGAPIILSFDPPIMCTGVETDILTAGAVNYIYS